MIINRDESEVAVLGEVQKHKVGIDERNINHIVTILSSNLYSHPMQSFLRETVANAIDSHLEAGVDEPIIITITDQDLSIRDFCTGISPERFQNIYTNIGSSTKRQSNNYIGSFGNF
jgi:HSP90 family molecular chaperone